jgi:RimJ/RimL family protein N-acetyltransferase
MMPQLLDIDTALLAPNTVVRRFRENDGQAFFELIRNNLTWLGEQFAELTAQVSESHQGEFFIRRKLAEWLLQQRFTFGIWENQSACLIGMIEVYEIDWSLPGGRVTFFIDQAFSRRSLMTEALNAVIDFAFHQLGLVKIRLRCDMDNFACQRLARRCGFRREGDLREEARRFSGEPTDVMLFGLTKAEYEKA